MKTLKQIRPLHGGFLKKYELLYDSDGREVRWEMISLNDLRSAGDLASRKTAVEIIARFEDGDWLLCREFRFTVNGPCYEFPTGIIDGDETPEQAAVRELREETGLEVMRVDRVLPPACYSVGVTDQIIVPVMVTVRGKMRPCREDYEDITPLKMSPKEVRALLRKPGLKITETCLLVLCALVDTDAEEAEDEELRHNMSYALFLRCLKECAKNMDETEFLFLDDRERGACILGYLPESIEMKGGIVWRKRVYQRPYWLGTGCDTRDGADFLTAADMLEAKVFGGRSIREAWERVCVLNMGGMPIGEWMKRCCPFREQVVEEDGVWKLA